MAKRMADSPAKKGFSVSEFVFNVKNVENRNFGLDLVKVIAMIFVPCLHFFLYNGHYYYYIMGGEEGRVEFFAATFIRDLLFICVPLFLLVSGALSYQRPADLSKRHYVKVTPIIVNSLIIGGLTAWYLLATAQPTPTPDPELSPLNLLRGIWSGSLPSYGWYVNMYVTLFVLMPVIDIAYNALDSQHKKTVMVISILAITVIPYSLNRIQLEGASISLMPSFMAYALFPVAYYVVGKYIAEFRIRVNKLLLVVVLIACLLYQVFKLYFTGQGLKFYDAMYADNYDFITLVTAVCFFLLIYNIDCKNKIVRSVMASLSSLTLSVYLLSWFCDQYFYVKNGITCSNFGEYIPNFIRTVPITLVVSIAAAYVVGILIKIISRPIMSLFLNHSIFKPRKKPAPSRTGYYDKLLKALYDTDKLTHEEYMAQKKALVKTMKTDDDDE